MFMFIVALLAIIGGGAGFLLSRLDGGYSVKSKLKAVAVGVVSGAALGVLIWVSIFLISVTLKAIFWIVLLGIVALVIYFIIRSVVKKK